MCNQETGKRYNELNEKFNRLSLQHWQQVNQEPHMVYLLKEAFASYLETPSKFYSDSKIVSKDVNDKLVEGWAFVSIYARLEKRKSRLVKNFDVIELPDPLYKKISLKLGLENLERDIDLDHVYIIMDILSKLDSQDQTALNKGLKNTTAGELRDFLNKNLSRDFLFNSLTENGYFVFDLAVTFSTEKKAYPKRQISIALGLTIHSNNIIELVIFDSESEYERCTFRMGDFTLFNLYRNRDNIPSMRRIIDSANLMSQYNMRNSLLEFVLSQDNTHDLYENKTVKQSKIDPNDLSKPAQEIEFEIKSLKIDDGSLAILNSLIKSDAFRQKAILVPDDVLNRIYLRFEWFIDKNYSYFFKKGIIQMNKKKTLNTLDKERENDMPQNITNHNTYVGENNKNVSVQQGAEGNQSNKNTNMKFGEKTSLVAIGSMISIGLSWLWHHMPTIFK